MAKETKVNLIEGDLVKTIIKLGYPLALASIVQTLYNLADTFWLGKLGREALAAPVISFHVLFFILSLAIGFSISGTSLVSQYTGAGQKEKVSKTSGNLLVYLMILSVVLPGIALIFGKELLTLLKTPAETFDQTLSYFRIIMWGMPLAFPIFVYQSVMNGYGDTKSPLKIELISAVLNLVLDPILIFGWFGFPKMGVAGAALTTVVTRGLASIIGMYYFFSGKKGIKLRLKDLALDFKLFPLICKIGVPASLGMAGTSLGFLVLMGIVGAFGTPVIAAYGIASRVIHFFMMPAQGISLAVTSIVGQNLGANNIKRAKDSVTKGILMISAVLIPSAIITAFTGKYVTMFFIPHDVLVQQVGQVMFYIVSPAVIFFGLSSVLSAAFQGSGYTVPVMVYNIVRIWLFRIPLVYVISMVILNGPSELSASIGIWWGMFFSNFLAFILIYVWYLKGNWARPRIEN
jgi:putative MATE family efflux protein